MVAIKSHVPDLLAAKGWDEDTFKGYCVMNGISVDTATRLAEGHTDITVKTLRKLQPVFGVDSICDLIDFDLLEQ